MRVISDQFVSISSTALFFILTLASAATKEVKSNYASNSFWDGDVASDIAAVFGRPQKDPSFQGCETNAYPPTNTEPAPEEYVIDLDLPPEYRWVKLAEDKSQYVGLRITVRHYVNQLNVFQISAMLDNLKNYTSGLFNGQLFKYIDEFMPLVGQTLPSPFKEEIQGMAEISGIPFGQLVLYNVFYELFTVCTSIIAQDPSGKLYHARNLDFGLFLGWDGKNETWLTTEYLRPMVVNLTFTRGNKTLFSSASFAGYIGILTGLKKDAFTLTINERFNIKGGFIGVLEWILMGKTNLKWLGFLTREIMENATSYKDAQKLIMKSSPLAPAYYILGGVKKGQGCVITRGLKKVDVWNLGEGTSDWYLVQTNYDHWKKPPFWDNRRAPAVQCLDSVGQKGLNFSGLYNVLSTRPVFNKLTTYTALMQVNSGALEIFVRDCTSPCWPW